MPFIVNLRFVVNPEEAIARHLEAHLRYIRETAAQLLAGGSVRDAGNRLEEDVILLLTDEREAAELWVKAEPFHSSGQVFDAVKIRPWQQVVPEVAPGALDRSIDGSVAR